MIKRVPKTVLEHEPINATSDELMFLKRFVPELFKFKQGEVCASNCVGVLTLPSGTVLEILPKVPMTSTNVYEWEETRQLFLKMLKCFRRVPKSSTTTRVLALKNFNMLSYFIWHFLNSLGLLVNEGLARQYVNEHDNLPYLKGRIEFKEHLRLNLFDKSRFFSSFDDLCVNRPVNRLIVTTLNRLELWVGYSENRKLLKDLQVMFEGVPPSQNIHSDWNAHSIDRSMPHYTETMKWIGLFLFGHGLATYSGQYSNIGLLFPMEQIFEDFVTASLRKHTPGYQVRSQGPQRTLVCLNGTDMFRMKPDITLGKQNDVFYVLDAKWKTLDSTNASKNFLIDQGDLYQLYTYGEQYSSKALILIYPMSSRFRDPLRFQFMQGKPLICFPFDIRDTKSSVDRLMNEVIQYEVA